MVAALVYEPGPRPGDSHRLAREYADRSVEELRAYISRSAVLDRATVTVSLGGEAWDAEILDTKTSKVEGGVDNRYNVTYDEMDDDIAQYVVNGEIWVTDSEIE